MTSFNLQLNSINETDELGRCAAQALAELDKYAVSLVNETIYKANREMKRFFVHMPDEGKRYHQRLAEQYTKIAHQIVEYYNDAIQHFVMFPDDYSYRTRGYYFCFSYRDGRLNNIRELCEKGKEMINIATRDYWFAVLKWLRGDY